MTTQLGATATETAPTPKTISLLEELHSRICITTDSLDKSISTLNTFFARVEGAVPSTGGEDETEKASPVPDTLRGKLLEAIRLQEKCTSYLQALIEHLSEIA